MDDAAIIGLISDTHGLMRQETLTALKGTDLIIHAGDVGSGSRACKDHAAAQCWDEIMQRSRSETEKSKTVN